LALEAADAATRALALSDAYASLKKIILGYRLAARSAAMVVEGLWTQLSPNESAARRDFELAYAMLVEELDRAGAAEDQKLESAAFLILDALESLHTPSNPRNFLERLGAARSFELQTIEAVIEFSRAAVPALKWYGDYFGGFGDHLEGDPTVGYGGGVFGRGDPVSLPSEPPEVAPSPEAELSPEAGPLPSAERRISIWISERPQGTIASLRVHVPYTLNFKVGQPVEGSFVSGPETEVPPSDVPFGGLPTEWLITSKTIELAAGTPGTLVETKRMDDSTTWVARFKLLIPEDGESEVPQLRVTPRTSRDARLDVVIFAHNEIYRTFAVELALEEAEAALAVVPAVLRDEAVHAPVGHLSLRTTHEWTTPPGTLSIAVLAGTAYARGDAGPGFIDQTTQWYGAQSLVAGKIENARSAAERFRARWEDYLNGIDPADLAYRLEHWAPEYNWATLGDYADFDHRRSWDEVRVSQELRDLAFDGHRLYEAFFPIGSDLRSWLDALAPGQRLNVSWLPAGNPGWLPHVPWGLMYLPDVPAPGEPVDPTGFLALRFRLGYTAHLVQAPSKALGDLEHSYGAHFLYWGDNPQDLVGVEARWQQQLWATLKNQVFIPKAPGPNAKMEVLKLLNEPEPPPVSVLYLFCQCNVGDGNDPVLRFGGTSQATDIVRRTEFGTKLLTSRPLVFANACTTAAGDPYFANELEDIFFDRGCRAYLGTEAKVPIRLASRFASIFFHFFYRRADRAPMAAGEAAAQTRLFLWTHYRNVGGLFYTYVNLYELFMAEDAEVVALRV
jgi:hypothetical protein